MKNTHAQTKNEHYGEMPVYLTTSEVAELLQVHPKTIGRWRQARKIPHQKEGHVIRFNRSKVLEWWEGSRGVSTLEELAGYGSNS